MGCRGASYNSPNNGADKITQIILSWKVRLYNDKKEQKLNKHAKWYIRTTGNQPQSGKLIAAHHCVNKQH